MTPRYTITGQVPDSSPLTALVGCTITMPAQTRAELLARLVEMRLAGITPTVHADCAPPWTEVAGILTGAVIAALATAIDGVLRDDVLVAWGGTAAMLAAGVALFPVLARAEANH